jgi:hypothetical protein
MNSLLIFKIWRHKLPALSAILTIAFVFLWPSIPLGSITKWLQFFYFYTPQNYFYALLAILSGIYVGLYVYNRKVAACCSIDSVKTGAAGSIIGILLGACPACIPVLAFLLPLSVTIVLSRLSLVFLVVAILIMLFSIYRMNGFKRFH